jgi:hypothetical protein
MRSKSRPLAFAILVLLLVSAGESPVRLVKVDSEKDKFGDIADSLGIKTLNGTFKFSRPFKNVTFKVAFYQNGKRLRELDRAEGHETSEIPKSAEGKFSVHVIDLDELRLKNAKPEHYRIAVCMESVAMGPSRFTMDVPKSKFDLSAHSSKMTFEPKEVSESQAPLLAIYGIKRRADGVSVNYGGNTPAELLEQNPNMDAMIIMLEFE